MSGNDNGEKSESVDNDVPLTPATATAAAVGFEPLLRMHGPLPGEHPFYSMIGRVASEWAHFEHILDVTIWAMGEFDQPRAACITSQIAGSYGRCQAIESLGQMRGLPKELITEIRKLKGKSSEVANDRARFVHDPWYIEQVGGRPAQFRAMPVKNPSYGFVEITADEASATLTKIRELRDSAEILKARILDQLGAST